MKCQSLFSGFWGRGWGRRGREEKNIISLSSAGFTHRVVTVYKSSWLDDSNLIIPHLKFHIKIPIVLRVVFLLSYSTKLPHRALRFFKITGKTWKYVSTYTKGALSRKINGGTLWGAYWGLCDFVSDFPIQIYNHTLLLVEHRQHAFIK